MKSNYFPFSAFLSTSIMRSRTYCKRASGSLAYHLWPYIWLPSAVPYNLYIHLNNFLYIVCKDNLNLYAGKFGQTISSRNFPEKYWGNMRCFWHIKADHDHKIRLVVQTIDFEDCSNCGCDFIQIFDGPNRYSKSLKKWCRNLPDLVSSGSDLYIEMRTDVNNYYRGFKAKYFAVHKNDGKKKIQSCFARYSGQI